MGVEIMTRSLAALQVYGPWFDPVLQLLPMQNFTYALVSGWSFHLTKTCQ